MCICINCRWVDRCKAYHVVEKQHGVDHLTQTPDLEPVDPRIHVSLIDVPGEFAEVEWDVRSCNSYVEDLGRWQRLRPGEEVPT